MAARTDWWHYKGNHRAQLPVVDFRINNNFFAATKLRQLDA